MTDPAIWGSAFSNGSTNGANVLYRGQVTSTAVLHDGRIVIVWADGDGGTLGTTVRGTSVRAQILNADGSPSGSSFQVNEDMSGVYSQPVVETLSNGRFVVVFDRIDG